MAASRAFSFGHDQAGDLLAAGFDGDGQRAAHTANAAIEREFADEQAVGNFLLVQPSVGAQDSQGHGQVESLNLPSDVGGRQVDGDVGGRNVVAAVLQRGADPVAAFAHRGVGQSDGVEVIFIGLDAGDVDLDLNDAGIDAIHRGARGLIEHEVVGSQTTRSGRATANEIGR